MQKLALIVAGIIFLAVSLLHFLRYSKAWTIVINDFTVPMQWSVYGGIVALILAIWMFTAAAKK